ncbi:hypothetical protein BpHYR1_038131 [Brachionus plicatilis]|uniref:Uncharacterized protein n=1 Tax=Brachionus plicatilis TaxID=10195 RepID=A0A3M7Q0L5_BRAPC|nr:hypothetical protein BpHYR1_038131 [Brachionus plicatilis]
MITKNLRELRILSIILVFVSLKGLLGIIIKNLSIDLYKWKILKALKILNLGGKNLEVEINP